MLERDGPKSYNSQLKKAGDWFYKQKDYSKAVAFYRQCGNTGDLVKGLSFMYNHNSEYASIEDTLTIIHTYVTDDIVKSHLFLLEPLAWAAYVEGRPEEMAEFLDRYYRQFPKIVLQTPQSAITRYSLLCMDYRESMKDVTRTMKKLTFIKGAKITSPSISQNLPFFHRSFRDLSEYALDTEENLLLWTKTIGVLLLEESGTLIDSIRAGLAYEQGNLAAAHEFALSACAKRKDSFAPEIQFCSFMHLSAVLTAQGRHGEAQKSLADTEAMIERHGAYYLSANFRAFSCRLRLADGDADAARLWLAADGESPHNPVSFYKLYRHFTTARAYIVTDDYNSAILLLKKLLQLSESYRRPLDVTEACILLAIAYWKKGRGDQKAALAYLERAVVTAYEYQYTQLFTNEGADLENMLNRMQKNAARQDCAERLPGAFTKSLYLSAVSASKHYKGMAGGRLPKTLKFTEPQKTVMRCLCEGYSRSETAEQMGISPDGVKSHIKSIYKKLDVYSSVEAVVKIKELGLPGRGDRMG